MLQDAAERCLLFCCCRPPISWSRMVTRWRAQTSRLAERLLVCESAVILKVNVRPWRWLCGERVLVAPDQSATRAPIRH